jgi:hypothetical protein
VVAQRDSREGDTFDDGKEGELRTWQAWDILFLKFILSWGPTIFAGHRNLTAPIGEEEGDRGSFPVRKCGQKAEEQELLARWSESR